MPRRLAYPVSLVVALLAVACGGGDGDSTGAGSTVSVPATLDSTPTLVAADKPTTAATPPPGQISVANEPFSVETPDGIVLKGLAYTPDGPKRQALIVVAPVDQAIWAESTQAFTAEGIAVFTFDPRGYGMTGGQVDLEALAADAGLITRFVMSREYPLVYLFGVGAEASQASVEAAANLASLSGLVTYGFPGAPISPTHVTVGGDCTWNGEDVFAIEAVRNRVLVAVKGSN